MACLCKRPPPFLVASAHGRLLERLLNKLSFEWPYWPSLGRQRAARLAAHPSPAERGLPLVCSLRTCTCTGRGESCEGNLLQPHSEIRFSLLLWEKKSVFSPLLKELHFFSTATRKKEHFFSTAARKRASFSFFLHCYIRASFFSTAARKKSFIFSPLLREKEHFFSTAARKRTSFELHVHFFSTAKRASFFLHCYEKKELHLSFIFIFSPLLIELHFFSLLPEKRASFFSTAARKKEHFFSNAARKRASFFLHSAVLRTKAKAEFQPASK